jgi:hypothetical protein
MSDSLTINDINTMIRSEDAMTLVFGSVERNMFADVDVHSTHTFRSGEDTFTIVDTVDNEDVCSDACLDEWATDANYPVMVMADVLHNWEVWTVRHYLDPENLASAVAHPFLPSDRDPGYGVYCNRCGRVMAADEGFRSYVERAFDAYIDVALWSSHEISEDGEMGEPLDANYEPGDVDPDALVELREDLVRFLADQWSDVRDLNAMSVGRDFWLTRNGHGAGFWDRGYGPRGDRLTDAAKVYGTVDLYVDVNGRIAC